MCVEVCYVLKNAKSNFPVGTLRKNNSENHMGIAVSIPITVMAMLSFAVGLFIYHRRTCNKAPPRPVSQGRCIFLPLYCEFLDDFECYKVDKSFTIYERLLEGVPWTLSLGTQLMLGWID